MGATVSTATVLFTDLVGSTAMRARLGEERADEVRRVHDQLIGDEVASCGGEVVKGLGDGVMASFGSASDAVAAAVAIQRAVTSHSRRHRAQAFELRIGISVGDVAVEDGDVFGTPVIEAARLCDAAGGSQILVSQIVEVLSRGRGDHGFASVGDLELKGLSEPLATVEVLWADVHQAGGVPLPTALGPSGLPLSGRDSMLDELVDTWKRVRAGESRMVLLAGEPGAGKTRLAAELAQRAHAHGAVVLYGHCEDHFDAPLLPIVGAIRGLLAAHPDSTAADVLGAATGRLVKLMPEVAERSVGLVIPEADDPEAERLHTLNAVGDVFGHAARDHGLVVVLDDLHWADRATVEALRMLARNGLPDGVLIVGTYRDTDVDPDTAFGTAVSELRRMPTVQRVAVPGLDVDGLRQLLDAASGDDDYDPDELDRLVTVILGETEGNPFFVAEVLSHLIETGALGVADGVWQLRLPVDDLGVPEGVRDVVGQRLNRLSEGARDALSVCAVIGPTFGVDVVASVLGEDVDVVLDQLDEARGASVITERGIGTFGFAHALVRASLIEGLSATRRARLHLKVAQHLSERQPHELDALALHWAGAAPTSEQAALAAIRAALAAGRRAIEMNTPDAVIDVLGRALALADDIELHDDACRAEVLIELAIAERRSGRSGYVDRLERAAALALQAGEPDLAARALVSDRGVPDQLERPRPERLDLIDAVLANSDRLSDDHRVALLGRRAGDVQLGVDADDRNRALAAAWQAIQSAPDTLSPDAAAMAIRGVGRSAHASLRPDLLEAALDELAATELRLSGRQLVYSMTERGSFGSLLGRLNESVEILSRAAALAADLHDPHARLFPQFNLALALLATGDLAAADEAIGRFDELSQGTDDADIPGWSIALQGVRSLQGSPTAELAEVVDAVAELSPDQAVLAAGAAAMLAILDRDSEATARLAQGATLRYGARHLDAYTPAALCLSALAATELASPDRREVLAALEELGPFDEQWAFAFFGTNHVGPLRLYLGMLRSSLGDHDEAVDLLTGARARMASIGARGYELLCGAHLAVALDRRSDPGDRDQARLLASEACERAASLGTTEVHRVCRHLAR